MSRLLWRSLRHELRRWHSEGLTAQFWIRDDDACDVTPQLERLAEFACRHGVDVGLAVVPAKLTDALVGYLRDARPRFVTMCHGWSHANHGSIVEPGEFGPDRPFAELRADAVRALATYTSRLGGASPYFVPPFGRITDELADALGVLGFALLSNGPSLLEARLARVHCRTDLLPPNLLRPGRRKRLDVHIDPIDWRAKTAFPLDVIGQRLLGELRLRRKRYIAPETPVGILTHHLVHDAAIWDACDELVGFLSDAPATVFPGLGRLMERTAPVAFNAPTSSGTAQIAASADRNVA